MYSLILIATALTQSSLSAPQARWLPIEQPIVLAEVTQATLPTPLIRWVFDEQRIVEGTLLAVNGPNPEVSGFPRPVSSPWGPAMEVFYAHHSVKIPWFVRNRWPHDPKENFTVTAAFKVEERAPGRRLAGCIFRGETGLVGWQILLEQGQPVLEIGHPDGRVLVESGRDVVGRWTWITAGYTDNEAWLMVDGEEVGRKPAPFGPLPYSDRAPLAVSGFWHGSGIAHFSGQFHEFRIDTPALTTAQAARLHRERVPVPALVPPPPPTGEVAWVIEPFLQAPLPGQVTVSFETSRPASAVVRHGPRPNDLRFQVELPAQTLHHARLGGLPAGTPWFYTVQVRDPEGNTAETTLRDFRTLPGPDQTIRFVATADTQASPDRSVRVAAAMSEHRPDFVTVVGDLVGEGWLKEHWRDHFFASMRPLLNHVPLVPVLGNHERNARLYYLYMDLPEPEYRYHFSAGPVDLFILDTEQSTDPGSTQYRWLESVLAESRAPWKIVMHHYPAFSSGYVNFDSLTSFGGDAQARNLVPLYERFGVDVVLSGHIHHYERTFPIRAGQVVADGITYFTLGGGGGGLTPPGRIPSWRFDFSRNRRAVHHFALITASEYELHIQVYDWDNHLFDELRLTRP